MRLSITHSLRRNYFGAKETKGTKKQRTCCQIFFPSVKTSFSLYFSISFFFLISCFEKLILLFNFFVCGNISLSLTIDGFTMQSQQIWWFFSLNFFEVIWCDSLVAWLYFFNWNTKTVSMHSSVAILYFIFRFQLVAALNFFEHVTVPIITNKRHEESFCCFFFSFFLSRFEILQTNTQHSFKRTQQN